MKIIFFFVSIKLHAYAVFVRACAHRGEMALREKRKKIIITVYVHTHIHTGRETERKTQTISDLSAGSGWTEERTVSFNAGAIATEWSFVLFWALHMRKIKIYYRRNVLVWIFFLFSYGRRAFFFHFVIMFPLGRELLFYVITLVKAISS